MPEHPDLRTQPAPIRGLVAGLPGRLVAVTLAAVALVILAGCGGGDEKDATASPDNGALQLEIEMSDALAFEPVRLQATVGQPVVLKIHNPGATLHDFSIEAINADEVQTVGGSNDQDHKPDGHSAATTMDYNLHLALDAGATGELQFIPREAGEYIFFCSVVGHQESGMQGTLVVAS